MKVNIKFYLMIDSFGNKASVTIDEDCDIVLVNGLKLKNGENAYFESDAYHIPNWCNENNITWKYIKREIDFDDLWNSKKFEL